MKRYPIRAVKYALQLVVLFILFYGILRAVGYDNAPLETLWTTNRGLFMVCAIVIFALLYPFFGFMKKTLSFDAQKKAEQVDNVMKMCGFEPLSNNNGVQVYRAVGSAKRLMMLYEDTITITTKDGFSVIEGVRKEVVKIYFRMGTFIG